MARADQHIDQGSTTTPERIESELARYGSPLTPYARDIADLGARYHVDPAFFLGVVWGENHYGTVGAAATTFNWASISNALYGGWPVAGSRWGQYPDARTGIEAFFRLISSEYYPNGQRTIESIWWGVGGSSTVTGTHAYAPAFENSPASLQTVLSIMDRVADPNGGTDGGNLLDGIVPAGVDPIAALALVAVGVAVLLVLDV